MYKLTRNGIIGKFNGRKFASRRQDATMFDKLLLNAFEKQQVPPRLLPAIYLAPLPLYAKQFTFCLNEFQ